uniref:VWFA domain-containing protein n=1 Tax=Spongospora subterranea TaxID=70186 RepID=A0A0H5QIC2_9EUKA|eukprot:CRZ01382.1 hypothetical protein [Spongospora subterranea]
MPTILLVSASLSLLQSDGSPDRCRKDVMQLMLLHLLKRVPAHDLIALYEFSAHETLCSVPFTDDHSNVRKRVYQIPLHERYPIGPALEKVVDEVAYAFPIRSRIQIIVITDGRLLHGWEQCRFRQVTDAVDDNDFTLQSIEKLNAFALKIHERYAMQLHVICFGDRFDTQIDDGEYERLVCSGGGSLCFIEMPTSSIKSHIDSFADVVYPTYSGVLLIGSAPVFSFRSDPDPCTLSFGSGLSWSTNVVVQGFLPTSDATCAPMSRHTLESIDPVAFNSFLSALRQTDRVALVSLNGSSSWLGLIRPVPPSLLVLDVLVPSSTLPWLNDSLTALDYAPPHDSSQSLPKVVPPASYFLQHNGQERITINHVAVQRDFALIVKLLHSEGADDALQELTALCDEMRNRARRFCCPSLLVALVSLLNSEVDLISPSLKERWLIPMVQRLQLNN